MVLHEGISILYGETKKHYLHIYHEDHNPNFEKYKKDNCPA